MKSIKTSFIVKSLITILAVSSVFALFIGTPDQEQTLVSKINVHIAELYQTVNGSDGDKASFLSHGFCFDGTLEQLALEAKDSTEISLVEDLGRDCRIVSGFINS